MALSASTSLPVNFRIARSASRIRTIQSPCGYGSTGRDQETRLTYQSPLIRPSPVLLLLATRVRPQHASRGRYSVRGPKQEQRVSEGHHHSKWRMRGIVSVRHMRMTDSQAAVSTFSSRATAKARSLSCCSLLRRSDSTRASSCSNAARTGIVTTVAGFAPESACTAQSRR